MSLQIASANWMIGRRHRVAARRRSPVPTHFGWGYRSGYQIHRYVRRGFKIKALGGNSVAALSATLSASVPGFESPRRSPLTPV